MNTPKASYLMAAYNESQEVLQDAVDSVIEQKYDNLEVIIVLDNPKRKDLSSILRQYAQEHPFIHVIENRNNIGLAESLNKGLSKATGEYILRADADDICLPERTQKQVDYLESNPEISIVGSSVDIVDEKNQFLRKKETPPRSANPFKTLQYKTLAYHPTWAVRRNVFDALDGYRDLPCSQDYDFLFRAAEQGYIIDNIAHSTIRHRMSASRTSESKSYEQHLISKIIRKSSRKRVSSGLDIIDSEQAWTCFSNPNLEKKKNYNLFRGRIINIAVNFRKKNVLKLVFNVLIASVNHPLLTFDLSYRYIKSKI